LRNIEIQLVDLETLQITSNIFSILVGKNGTGKSTLLGDLTKDISHGIERYRRQLKNRKLPLGFFPVEVIAVSTSPFDKFPLVRSDRFPNYTYLGLRDLHSSNFGLAYLSKIIASLIECVSKEELQAKEIAIVLDYLGYRDDILMRFESLHTRGFLEVIAHEENIIELIESRPTASGSRRLNKAFFLNQDDSINKKRASRLQDIARKAVTDSSFRLRFEIMLNRNGLSVGHDESEDILFLIQAGVVRLRDVLLVSIDGNEPFSIKDASSGEQSIILSILGIASKIKNNSLICIDEPEICLHPQWQEKYIEILTRTFSRYENCHFIIATHSPHVISKLSNINSFVVDLESGVTKNANQFTKHSADYQLANVFDFPGYKNEYLSRIALNTFVKVSKNKRFDDEDLLHFEKLKKQSKYLDTSDPVYDLYLALERLGEEYA